MTNCSESRKHRTLCNLIAMHLFSKGIPYERNVIYSVDGIDGEVDVLAHFPKFNVMYEAKSTDMARKRKQALEQFRRYKSTHTEVPVRGVYVSDGVVKRL